MERQDLKYMHNYNYILNISLNILKISKSKNIDLLFAYNLYNPGIEFNTIKSFIFSNPHIQYYWLKHTNNINLFLVKEVPILFLEPLIFILPKRTKSSCF